MVNKSAVFQIFSLILLTSCSEKLEFARVKGTYSGTFHYFSNADSKQSANAPVTVYFTQNAFESSAGGNYIPAGGAGVFTLLDGRRIRFEDRKAWTANFDWGLILSGEYHYQVKRDSLILTKGTEKQSLYQYRLKRIN